MTAPNLPAGVHDLLDVEAFMGIVGCSRAMADHHIERKKLASAYVDGMPMVRRIDAEAFRQRYTEMQAAAREIAEDADDLSASHGETAGPGAR